MCKGGLKHLDRLGIGSSAHFHNISTLEVLRYIVCELYDNGLFCCGPLVLSQGSKAVPIGGFFPAQLYELWAMWREFRFVFGEDRDKVCALWSQVMLPVCSELFPNASPPSLSLSGDTDFTLAPHVARTMLCRHSLMVHRTLHSVSLDALSRDGFDGWWSPMEKLHGCMHLGDYNILLVRSSAWDWPPGPRVSFLPRL